MIHTVPIQHQGMYDAESIKDLIFLAFEEVRSVSITRLKPQEVIQRYEHFRILLRLVDLH